AQRAPAARAAHGARPDGGLPPVRVGPAGRRRRVHREGVRMARDGGVADRLGGPRRRERGRGDRLRRRGRDAARRGGRRRPARRPRPARAERAVTAPRAACGGRRAAAGLVAAGPLVSPSAWDDTDFAAFQQGPSARHWLGTTQSGRDVFALTLHGARRSMLIGAVVAVAATGLAAVVGAVAGYAGGRADRVLMWGAD